MKTNRFGRAEILSPDQISLLFTEGFIRSRDRALFGICLYTAARINEACTLLFGDVIGVNGVREKIVIRRPNTKGKRDTREVDVHPDLKGFLQTYQVDRRHTRNPYLFPGQSGIGHLKKGSVDWILRKTCQRLKIEGVSTHSFRRTALTAMSDAGIPLRHVQAISGHRTLSALDRYLGVTEKQKQSAIAALKFK